MSGSHSLVIAVACYEPFEPVWLGFAASRLVQEKRGSQTATGRTAHVGSNPTPDAVFLSQNVLTIGSKNSSMEEPKIYFAASIRGGREHVETYGKLVDHLKEFGNVLTEHVGDRNVEEEEDPNTDREIFERDIDWLVDADMVVAEVTTPSLGVGFEISKAVEEDIPVLCLFRPGGKNLSAMINGCPDVEVFRYNTVEDALEATESFVRKHTS